MLLTRLAALIGAALLVACGVAPAAITRAVPTATPAPVERAAPAAPAAPPSIAFRLLADHPHDAGAWTQGLLFAGPGRLYEGTGDYARSSLREVDLASGAVLRSVGLGDPQLYGEGIAQVGGQIFQITWQNGLGLIYDAASFAQVGSFRYPAAAGDLPREGWGLTYDGAHLIMSDGSATLYFIDPAATAASGLLAIERTVTVSDDAGPVGALNELEYIDGAVFANIWYSDLVARIDPASGQVTGYLDLGGLLPAAERARVGADVLNGIAYDPASRQIFITGKLWPRLFVITLDQSAYLPLIARV